MKHFTLKGPETSTDFDIEDDEMVIMNVVKVKDWERGHIKNLSPEYSQEMKNRTVTNNA